MEEETPFSATIRGNKWILLFSHLLIRFFLCLFCSCPMTTVPLLEDRSGSLNYWFRSSRRRKRMYVCEEEWELATSTNTSLSISRVSTMATMGLALSSRSNVCSTPTILTKCSDNTLNTHNTLTIHAALVISEHIFLCWRVCFFLGILDISSPFMWLKVDCSQSLFYFVPQENITVKLAWKIKSSWWQRLCLLPQKMLRSFNFILLDYERY